MIYITTKQKPREKQITWIDLITEDITVNDLVSSGNAGTVTRTMEQATPELLSYINVCSSISKDVCPSGSEF